MTTGNRVINDPDLVVEDMLRGFLAAHAETLCANADNARVVQRIGARQPGRVGIVTGGGSGHEPAFLGYVGEGLCDAVAVGEIFSSPTARSFYDAMRAADGGAGVACLYGNYAGDNMNVKMAVQMAARDGIRVQTVVANDDVPSAPKGDEAKRRGVAGEILMWKVAGAKAAQGASLDAVVGAAQKAIDNTRSIGIGLSACVIPAVGKANFQIEPGNMELGIGHHGEPGIGVRRTPSAAGMAEIMLDAVLPDLPIVRGERVALLVSGLGATPLMELYILYAELSRRLDERGIAVAFQRVGNLFTSLEMMGVTLTLMRLDDELEACLRAPCCSVGMTVPGAHGAPAQAHWSDTVRGRVAAPAVQPPLPETRRAVPAPRTCQGPCVALDGAGGMVRELIAAIVENRGFLSEIDGLIGDGDHGINMAKGFTGCDARLDAIGPERAASLPAALEQLSQALMDDIGGSMGPLYGSFFLGFVNTLEGHARLDAALFGEALASAIATVQTLGNAQVGDKSLIDTLVPARDAYARALESGAGFAGALQAMARAAEAGKDSTKNLQARIGRSARLGPRSIGVLDAGATSCWIILRTMAQYLQRQLGA
ncbi:dihydroxyacetone kinase subunit L [Verminephrobacter aporrectodeae subsp. tuberculatae]|uniref:dihydroxyacetone kinase subunit DhaL n=1 Tax=Verminephrobacter aporrectodeae TaxID=1110389 RepID=UPI002238BABB|nr:dihydroxyacetone kinase subunit DhaL [Verminephrobacter aporrectodeae]MCW5258086.1 dihydroxyacetone kinase subunit L [Verminephrobacter aporrectodeae subsp. tuberculatae]